MDKVWELANNLLPVFMGVMVAFGVWVTSELYAAKYSTLKSADGRRITAEAADYTDDKYAMLLSEINRLREAVDHLNDKQAETLAEVRLLKEIMR